MSTWHFYDVATGLFTGRTLQGDESHLQANVPEGCAAWPAPVDERAQRVSAGELVAWAPPPPDAGVVLTKAQATAVAQVQGQIDALELQQARPAREIVLALAAGQAIPEAAASKFAWVEEQITALRAVIDAMRNAADLAELAAIQWVPPTAWTP